MTAAEDTQTRIRRLRLRSWRRGMREMDLILGRFADSRLATLDAETLALYEAMLDENDQDLFAWFSGQVPAPTRYAGLLAQIDSGRAPGAV